MIDGEEKPSSLFKLVKSTQEQTNPNNKIKFSDNSRSEHRLKAHISKRSLHPIVRSPSYMIVDVAARETFCLTKLRRQQLQVILMRIFSGTEDRDTCINMVRYLPDALTLIVGGYLELK